MNNNKLDLQSAKITKFSKALYIVRLKLKPKLRINVFKHITIIQIHTVWYRRLRQITIISKSESLNLTQKQSEVDLNASYEGDCSKEKAPIGKRCNHQMYLELQGGHGLGNAGNE